VVPPGAPDLAIAVSHIGDFPAGGSGTYTLAVTNIGLAPTAGTITVTDTLPHGLFFVSATGTGWVCAAADQEVTCMHDGPVNPGASSAITLTVDVNPVAFPGAMNRAVVSNQSDRNASNDSTYDATVVSRKPL
jgi:uncharacterized repeat protein (TIGR01451 family)